MQIFIVLILVLGAWSMWGYFSSQVEQAEYKAIKKGAVYEIRTYPKHIVAQATVGGDYKSAMNAGFRIVAGYIFGANTNKQSIAMTAPVVSSAKKEGSAIAMTAPVIIEEDNSEHTISFGMPKKYTLETLPTPTDSRVKIVEIPEKTFAVIRFFGYRNSSKIERVSQKLKQALETDKIETIGNIAYAGYNAPWIPPWMTKNEVLIEITK